MACVPWLEYTLVERLFEGGFTGSVAVVVVDRNSGTVNRELFEVRSAVAVELGVEVGEESALEERILGEVDAADDVAGLEL